MPNDARDPGERQHADADGRKDADGPTIVRARGKRELEQPIR